MDEERPTPEVDVGSTLSAGCAASLVAPIALLLVGLVASGAVDTKSALSFLPLYLLFGAPIAFAHVILIALPLYSLIGSVVRVRIWSCTAAGALIGALPMTLLLSLADPAPIGEVIVLFGEFAVAGAAGGFMFGRVMSRHWGEDAV